MRTMWKEDKLSELMRIPGVGKSIARDLWNLGIRNVDDLKGKSPEKLYEQSNDLVGTVQDRCLLYVFRCAVYFAGTAPGMYEKEKLNWWYWKATFMFQTFNNLADKLPEISRKDGGSLLLYIQLTGIRDFFETIKNKVPILHGLEKTFYGATEFSVRDNNGYVLTFAEDEKQ